MANFFGKPKAPSASSSGSSITLGGPTLGPAKETPSGISQFEKTFKPFLLKKGASMAPTNWFTEVRTGRTYKGKEKEDNVIIIDDDEESTPKQKPQPLHDDNDIQMVDATEWKDIDLGQMTAEGKSSFSRRLNSLTQWCL